MSKSTGTHWIHYSILNRNTTGKRDFNSLFLFHISNSCHHSFHRYACCQYSLTLGRTIADGTWLMALATSCSAKALVNVYVFIWSWRSLKQKFQNRHCKSFGMQVNKSWCMEYALYKLYHAERESRILSLNFSTTKISCYWRPQILAKQKSGLMPATKLSLSSLPPLSSSFFSIIRACSDITADQITFIQVSQDIVFPDVCTVLYCSVHW